MKEISQLKGGKMETKKKTAGKFIFGSFDHFYFDCNRQGKKFLFKSYMESITKSNHEDPKQNRAV